MTSSIGIKTFHLKEVMQIQPPENSVNGQAAKASRETQNQKPSSRDDQVLTGLSDEVASVLQKGIEMDQTAVAAIEHAKKAISDGVWDTPEACMAAAENLLQFGV